MLILEGIIALVFLVAIGLSLLLDIFTVPEWTVSFLLCQIWLATIDMRRDKNTGKDD